MTKPAKKLTNKLKLRLLRGKNCRYCCDCCEYYNRDLAEIIKSVRYIEKTRVLYVLTVPINLMKSSSAERE